MTEVDARDIILQVKQHAYRAQHVELASRILEVNEFEIVNDPIVRMLRTYTNHEDTTQYLLEQKVDTSAKRDPEVRAVTPCGVSLSACSLRKPIPTNVTSVPQ